MDTARTWFFSVRLGHIYELCFQDFDIQDFRELTEPQFIQRISGRLTPDQSAELFQDLTQWIEETHLVPLRIDDFDLFPVPQEPEPEPEQPEPRFFWEQEDDPNDALIRTDVLNVIQTQEETNRTVDVFSHGPAHPLVSWAGAAIRRFTQEKREMAIDNNDESDDDSEDSENDNDNDNLDDDVNGEDVNGGENDDENPRRISTIHWTERCLLLMDPIAFPTFGSQSRYGHTLLKLAWLGVRVFYFTLYGSSVRDLVVLGEAPRRLNFVVDADTFPGSNLGLFLGAAMQENLRLRQLNTSQAQHVVYSTSVQGSPILLDFVLPNGFQRGFVEFDVNNLQISAATGLRQQADIQMDGYDIIDRIQDKSARIVEANDVRDYSNYFREFRIPKIQERGWNVRNCDLVA